LNNGVRTSFIAFILLAFSFSTFTQIVANALPQNLIKIAVTHSHDLDDHNHHHAEHHEHQSHNQDKSDHESQDTSQHASHTHELLLSIAQPVVLLSKLNIVSVESLFLNFPPSLAEGSLLDRPLDSIFRPPIHA
jgi:hypothetical protein